MLERLYDDEFININMSLINSTTIDDVKKLLSDRTNNMEHENFTMYNRELLQITALDDFMAREISKGTIPSHGSVMEAYFVELNKQLVKQPLLFLSLPIRCINISVLKKYLPDINYVIDECNKKKNEAMKINEKFATGLPVSSVEMNKLVKFFNYSCVYDTGEKILGAQDRLVKYLLNNANSLGLNSASFIIKYFGYKKCRELGLTGMHIFVGEIDKVNDLKPLGGTLKNTITISKEQLVGTTFKENKIDDEYSMLKNGKMQGLLALKTLYHELRHIVQDKERIDRKETDSSYMMATRNILLMLDSTEYGRNYRYYNIEDDANEYGWRWVRDVLKDYMGISEKDRLNIYADIYSFKYMIRKKFSSKRDKDNKQCFSCLFEKKQLDKFFKSNPDALKGIYSHFRIFYNDDGTSKSITDLMRISSSSTVNFGTFYLSQVSARIVSKEKINYDIVDKLSIEEKKNIVANYDTLIYQIYRKFSILSTKLSDGSYLYDSMDNDLKKHIEYNVKYYFQLALNYSNEVSVFINRYPELVNHNISYYITNTPHINYYLKLINKNKLVQRVVEGKQIDIIHVPDGISYRNSGRSK